MSNRIKEEFLQKSEPVRLNKYLSEAGVCSRREADRLIESGIVTVDGKTAAPGMKVEDGQEVRVGKNHFCLPAQHLNYFSRHIICIITQTGNFLQKLIIVRCRKIIPAAHK